MYYCVQIYSCIFNKWFDCEHDYLTNVRDAIKLLNSKKYSHPRSSYRVIDSNGTVIRYNKEVLIEKIEKNWLKEGF